MRRSVPLVILFLSLVAAGALAAAASKAEVSIVGRKFSPATLTIAPNETVTWTNNDDFDHTVVADDGSFDSGKLKPNQSFSHKFTKAGTYSYACGLHPREKAKVIVRK